MKELELSPRLKAIADKVSRGAKVADVGTDHAYLPVWLLQKEIPNTVIATDLREGPLGRGQKVAEQYEVSEQISFRCCDGLCGIEKDEVDTIVIAGMGGENIISILDQVSWSKSEHLTYFFQPMSSVPELRGWLSTNGFSIEQEEIVAESKKFYIILTVRPGQMQPMTLGEVWAGRQSGNRYFIYRLEYLNDLIRRRERALEGMKKAAKSNVAEMQVILNSLYELRREWISWQQ